MSKVDPTALRAYLLGSLAENQDSELEEEFFTDDTLFEQAELAQDDLIEQYLQGALPPAEKRLFESRFLASPESRQYVHVCRALRNKFAPQPHLFAPPPKPSFLSSFRLGWSFAVAFALLTVIGSALLFRGYNEVFRLRNHEQELTAAGARLNRQVLALQESLQKASAARGSDLSSLVLHPGNFRDRNGQTNISIASDTGALRLTLDADIPASFQGLHTSLTRLDQATGNKLEIWSQQWLLTGKSTAPIVIDIPARLLQSGDYLLTLSGKEKAGRPLEPLSDYPLRITKR